MADSEEGDTDFERFMQEVCPWVDGQPERIVGLRRSKILIEAYCK